MRWVLHGTRRKTGSVRETSRAVRTFGVRPVRIGFARLAHQNLFLVGGRTSRAAFHGASCTPVGQRPAPRTSAPCALRVRTRVLMGGTSSAAFHRCSCTPVGQRPAPRTSALRALRIRTCVLEGGTSSAAVGG